MPNQVRCIIVLGEYDNSDIVNDGDTVEKIHEFSHDENDENTVGIVKKIHKFSHDGVDCNLEIEKIREFSLQPATDLDIKQYRRLRRNMVIPMMVGKFQMQISKQINIL